MSPQPKCLGSGQKLQRYHVQNPETHKYQCFYCKKFVSITLGGRFMRHTIPRTRKAQS